ncbi:beta-ketoacyl synthase N-terminal-like domain-containing protein, partial [Streptomyces pathocidini]|uniref:type I polyketide synthase n=1 Tax=Streptomyces pathocidini TaxID=1650571 RepID=UPI0033E8224B
MTDSPEHAEHGEQTGQGARIRGLLTRLVSEACLIAPEEIAPDRPLAEYGLSSRDAVAISGELEAALGRSLPTTLLWQNPSIDALVHHLCGDSESHPPGEGPARAARGTSGDPAGAGAIAVVGVGCRLPGGIEGPDAFWDFLMADGDAVGEVPAERWRDFDDGSAATAAALARTTRWGAFLDDVAGFDAEFFGITPREAQLMDPQQRLLLEVACEALDNAGLAAAALRSSATGVFVGLSSLEYGLLTAADPARATEWTGTGAAGSIAANRISYALDLRGPSITVDTACSSSLVALHQACHGLRAGECDTALAAGVNLLLSPMVTAGFDQVGVLAADGRCKAFDAAADGIARGEGCGVVVLKRLADALRDGDPVRAVVRGTAVNSDGRSAGLVAPNPVAQQALLRAALRDAGVAGADVDYVEAHGTGTLLGDPIEAGALGAVLGEQRPAERPLLIGSVKSNLGHLEGAAGITGVIKTVLALQHRTLPRSLHFREPNPHIDFDGSRLRVVGRTEPWPGDGGRPALAGVSAFGFGGTNAHAVLEEFVPEDAAGHGAVRPPAAANTEADPRAEADPGAEAAARAETSSGTEALQWAGTSPRTGAFSRAGREPDVGEPCALVLSARSAERLGDAAQGLADWLMAPAGLRTPLEDVAYTLGHRRHGPVSAAVVGRGRESVAEALRALAQNRRTPGVVGPHPAPVSDASDPTDPASDPGGQVSGPGPVFVFSGYGSQWEGMGRRLLAEDPAFAAAVGGLDPLFAAEAGTPLSEMITNGVPLDAVESVQPPLFGLQLALADTWRAYGVEPAAVIGHSMGEVAAAVVAGALEPVDGLRIMLRRSVLLGGIDAKRTGAMAAVELPLDARAEVLARHPGVEVAVDASPQRCTVTGPAEAVGRLVADLEEAGHPARLLQVGAAGHSPAVDPLLPELRAAFADIPGREPALPWYGTVYDDPRRTPCPDADYWCGNTRRPVRMRQAVAAAAEDGHAVFLEISPHPVATLTVGETLEQAAPGRRTLVLPTLRRDGDEPLLLRATLAALHTAGAQRGPELLWPAGRRTALPTAPWRHVRHWVDSGAAGRAARPAGHPLLGTRVDVPGTRRALWRGDVGTDGWYRPAGQVHGTTVLTLAACAEMALAAAAEVFATPVDDLVVRDLALDHLLPLSGTTPVTTALDPTGPGRAQLAIHTRSSAGTWVRHASATVEAGVADTGRPGLSARAGAASAGGRPADRAGESARDGDTPQQAPSGDSRGTGPGETGAAPPGGTDAAWTCSCPAARTSTHSSGTWR